MKGLSQGMSTSPILTELVLNDWVIKMEKENKAKAVFYADDGIFFSNRPITIEGCWNRGIHIHPEKSGYIKYKGK